MKQAHNISTKDEPRRPLKEIGGGDKIFKRDRKHAHKEELKELRMAKETDS